MAIDLELHDAVCTNVRDAKTMGLATLELELGERGIVHAGPLNVALKVAGKPLGAVVVGLL